MNLLVFLGAGVSVPSGLPTAAELTKTVLTAPYRELGRGRFQSGRRPLSEPRSNDTTPRIKRYLRLLLRHDLRDISRVGASPKKGGHKASGAIFRGNTTYEDLYFLSQQLGLWNIGLSDSSLTTPFMEALEKKAGDLLRGRTKIARLSDLASLGEQACWYIETVVADTLRRGQPKGMDLLRELVGTNEIDRLEIVTLNHDTLVEQFLTSNGIEYADGFGAMDGDVRWGDDRSYDTSARIKLYKLHGSVNWYSFLADGRARTAVLVGNDPLKAKSFTGTALMPFARRPSFLSGINKANAYARGIYADLHHRFGTALRNADLMIMSGYGWGDTAINFQLCHWLDRQPNNSIILLHEKPEDLAGRSLLLASSYDAYVHSGQLVPIRTWMSDTSVADLRSFLRPCKNFNGIRL